MIRSLFATSAFLLSLFVSAQPNTEVYLFDLDVAQNDVQVTNPRNISNNPGYDNQPSFTNDGYLLYTSTRNDQTDVVKYNVKSRTKAYITSTSGSEYSPTPLPDGSGFSAIRLEKNGEQLLWKYDWSGKSTILYPDLVVGYQTWFEPDRLFVFVLGEPNTLMELDLPNMKHEIITSQIGRSLHKIPGQQEISFIDKSDTTWMIMSYSHKFENINPVMETVPGSEDMAWLNEGFILMGSGNDLYIGSVDNRTWKQVIRMETFDIPGVISRLALSPEQNHIAIVITE
jgi:hypothetical protein